MISQKGKHYQRINNNMNKIGGREIMPSISKKGRTALQIEPNHIKNNNNNGYH